MAVILEISVEGDPRGGISQGIILGLDGDVVIEKPDAADGADPVEGGPEAGGAESGGDAAVLGAGESDAVEDGERDEGGAGVLRGGSGADLIFGGDHGETICAGLSEDDVDGGAGSDVIYGGGGADILRGGDGEDRLIGGSGADWLYGDGGADCLFGGDGDDQIILEIDADVVTGGKGADIFFMRSGQGVITDFTPGEDVLNLATFVDFTSLWDVKKASVEAGGDIEIALGAENSLVLCDTRLADLDAGDFAFGFA